MPRVPRVLRVLPGGVQPGHTFIPDGEVMSDDSPASPEPWAVPSPSSAQSAPPPSTGLPPTGPGAAPPLPPAPLPPSAPLPPRERPPWRRAGLVAAAVGAAAVLAGGGYLAGVALSEGSHSTTLTSAEGTAGGAGRSADGVPGVPGAQDGAGGRGGHGGGDFAAGGVTAGVITSAKGETLVLQTRQGQSVTVHAVDSTTVRGASADSIDDLAVGDVVLVAGARADDGSITATQILTGPPGGDRGAPNGTAPKGGDDNDDGSATAGDQVHRVTT